MANFLDFLALRASRYLSLSQSDAKIRHLYFVSRRVIFFEIQVFFPPRRVREVEVIPALRTQ